MVRLPRQPKPRRPIIISLPSKSTHRPWHPLFDSTSSIPIIFQFFNSLLLFLNDFFLRDVIGCSSLLELHQISHHFVDGVFKCSHLVICYFNIFCFGVSKTSSRRVDVVEATIPIQSSVAALPLAGRQRLLVAPIAASAKIAASRHWKFKL